MIVKAGKHRSGSKIKPYLNPQQIHFTFKVDRTWIYSVSPSINGISKICGLSWGHHHQNSVRLGFICENSRLYLHAYCYLNGVSPQQDESLKPRLMEVFPQQQFDVVIKKHSDKYLIFINNIAVYECPAGKTKLWGYRLNPYIGGQFTLPHDVNFDIVVWQKEMI